MFWAKFATLGNWMSNSVNRVFIFLKWIFIVSRPRIWIYTLGSFILGISISSHYLDLNLLFRNDILFLGLWLTLPANLFLYATNDAFDYETDHKNPKKQEFEIYAKPNEKNKLIFIGIICLLPLIPIFFVLPLKAIYLIILWFILVLTYNLPPLRFKATPVLDIFFSFNFPLWGVIGYFLASNQLPSISILGIIALFSIAMHLYTQSIDLEYDKSAGVKTSSVLIGSIKNNLLVSAGVIFLLMAILIAMKQYFIGIILSGYTLFFLVQFYSKRIDIKPFEWYRRFIYLHYLLGFLFFLKFIAKI